MSSYEHWLAGLDAQALTSLLAVRADAVVYPPPRTYAALAHLLALQRSTRAALRLLDRGALAILEAVAAGDGLTRAQLAAGVGEGTLDDVERALGSLLKAGLVWPGLVWPGLVRPSATGYRAVPLPHRIDNVGFRRLAAPVVVDRGRAAPAAQQLAVARFLEIFESLLAEVDSGSVTALATGGVGTRQVLSLVDRIHGCEIFEIELALHLAAEARLIEVHGKLVRCTTRYERWASASSARRLSIVAAAWWCSELSPTNRTSATGKTVPVLASRPVSPASIRLRHNMIDSVPVQGFADADAAVEYAWWAMPIDVADADPHDAPAVWREAAALGILADGRPTELSRVLSGSDAAVSVDAIEQALEPICARILAEAECVVRLLPDLTAVVSGPVSQQVSAMLGSAAVREARGSASTWRFTADSMRSFFSVGGNGEKLLDALAATAVTPVPQPLEYLVRDTARVHAESGKAESGKEEDHKPVARTAPPAARRSLTAHRTGSDPALLAQTLVSGVAAEIDLDAVTATVRRLTRLPARDSLALARAVGLGTPVLVDVTDSALGIVRHPIHDAVLDSGTVHGWSGRTEDRQSLELSRIRMVVEVTSD